MTNKLKQTIEELYNLNANISAITFIHKQRFTLKDQEVLNKRLGEIIGKLRDVIE